MALALPSVRLRFENLVWSTVGPSGKQRLCWPLRASNHKSPEAGVVAPITPKLYYYGSAGTFKKKMTVQFPSSSSPRNILEICAPERGRGALSAAVIFTKLEVSKHASASIYLRHLHLYSVRNLWRCSGVFRALRHATAFRGKARIS